MLRWVAVSALCLALASCGQKPSAPAAVLASAAPTDVPTLVVPTREPMLLASGQIAFFRASDDLSRYLLQGFSAAEEGGTWTQAKQAQLTLPLSENLRGKPVALQVKALGFVSPPALPAIELIISVAGMELGRTKFAKPLETKTLTVQVPANLNTADGLTLTLDIPKATSPKAVGSSPDLRELGVFLNSIEIRESNLINADRD